MNASEQLTSHALIHEQPEAARAVDGNKQEALFDVSALANGAIQLLHAWEHYGKDETSVEVARILRHLQRIAYAAATAV